MSLLYTFYTMGKDVSSKKIIKIKTFIGLVVVEYWYLNPFKILKAFKQPVLLGFFGMEPIKMLLKKLGFE